VPVDVEGHDRTRYAELRIRRCPLLPATRGAAPKSQSVELPTFGDMQQVIKQCPRDFVFVRSFFNRQDRHVEKTRIIRMAPLASNAETPNNPDFVNDNKGCFPPEGGIEPDAGFRLRHGRAVLLPKPIIWLH
jgi:hypothetical protein